MRKIILLLLLFISGCTSLPLVVADQKQNTEKLGTFAIPPQFADAMPFHDGLAAVLIGGEKDGKWGYIDKTGKMVIPPQFNLDRTDTLYSNYKNYKEVASQPHSFSEGLAAFYTGVDYKFGYMDKTGKITIPVQYVLAGDFNEGRAAVQLADKSYALIDKSGKVIAQYGRIGPFENGLAPVRIGDENSATGFIDHDGKLVITLPAEVGSVRYHHFNEGLAPFVTRGKEKRYGFIDQTGKVVIPA